MTLQRGTVYYISSDGDDNNSGKSPNRAWKTIERVNAQSYSPGEKILFRGGEEFEGTIIFTSEDAGSHESRVIISSFGAERAIIMGMGKEGIRVDSCHFLGISNLNLIGSGRKSGNNSDGLFIQKSDGVILDNLETSGFQHSGIHLHQCNDAVITHVYAHENGFAGIHVTGNTIWDT
ncbi:MAG: right-handed parallel beta-helix repeat-containing protein, partial [Bacteroidales bacterium]|nr:right-handed parallel beta-helix repeat-containing protein [Bacteroidales bacterium]